VVSRFGRQISPPQGVVAGERRSAEGTAPLHGLALFVPVLVAQPMEAEHLA
jgi:hypothetical protein